MSSRKSWFSYLGVLWGVVVGCMVLTLTTLVVGAWGHEIGDEGIRFVQIEAKTREDRTAIANMGVSIESIRSDSVWGFAHENALKRLKSVGIKVMGSHDLSILGDGKLGGLDFPPSDARFHNYLEAIAALQEMADKNPDIAKISSIGKSIDGRDILAIHINTSPEALESGTSGKPGVIFMGAHHAREHLSVEIPLMLVQYLLDNRRDPKIAALLDTRDIWVIPMVNPDGAEWDISSGKYRWWRKNRRNNGNGTFGVDLNRNYGFKWGTGGSDTDPASDVFMGKTPFSEPETQAVRAFVEAHLNAKVLLSFHTFSELILYPWGHTYDSVGSNRDLQVFEKMATTMAQWNKYKPQQSSDLYIASGDTTDWAYGEHGIFAFTFELSPKSMFEGGFYPGARVIDRVFQDNLKPCLYLIDVADDPYKVLDHSPRGWLRNYVEPRIPHSLMWETHPLQ